MTGLLPRRTDGSKIDHEPGMATLAIDDPAADVLFATLACETGKRIVKALEEVALPKARLADRVDTSLQNVQYHVSRLEAAGLVEVVATDLSCKGSEMDVYALAGDPIVVTVDDGFSEGVEVPTPPVDGVGPDQSVADD